MPLDDMIESNNPGRRSRRVIRPGMMVFFMLPSLVVFGCGGTEADLMQALADVTAEQTLVCQPGPLRSSVVALREDGQYVERTQGNATLMAQLETASLLEAPGRIQVGSGLFARQIDAQRITEFGGRHIRVGAGFTRRDEGRVDGICYARRVPAEILEYTEPGEGAAQVQIRARFRYDETPLEWVPGPEAIGLITGVGSSPVPPEHIGAALFTKTNKGWRVEGVTW